MDEQQLESTIQTLTDRVDALEDILREFVADVEHTLIEGDIPLYTGDTQILLDKHFGDVDCKMRDSKSESDT